MLTESHIAIVQSTVPVLEQAGTDITDYFYRRMFRHNPELQHIFNMSNQSSGKQKTALFEAILAYAKFIDDLDVLSAAVERITHKHASLGIQPEHYDIVGHHLIETLRELLLDGFTPSIEAAWTAAYQQLANLFIDKEETLYFNRQQHSGGWRGKRRFVLVEKKAESELVTSFVFKPKDDKALLSFRSGQYLGIAIKSDDWDYQQIRQYSLSASSNNKTYQISVKREHVEPEGLVSNFLHKHLAVFDEVDLFAPGGDFYLLNSDSPTVLISAGVGITPMKAMLETLDQNFAKDVTFVHGCKNTRQHSFKNATESVCKTNGWAHHIWYEEPEVAATAFSGLIDLTQIKLPVTEGHFYMCGPVGFMRFIHEQLTALGVEPERIHYEVFGPHAEL